jgi:hypothetical protein
MAPFHELKNAARTKGHRVSILSPQTLILPKPSPNRYHFLAEYYNLRKNIGPLSSSMDSANDGSFYIYPYGDRLFPVNIVRERSSFQ